jgi:hypothetical protein
MHTPVQVIVLPIPVPVAGNGWLSGSRRPWPAKPRPSHRPLKQSIPSPAAREALEQARRLLAERRGRTVGRWRAEANAGA